MDYFEEDEDDWDEDEEDDTCPVCDQYYLDCDCLDFEDDENE